ncbi:MAG: thioredoxin family protein [Prevotella sp.]|nr:thioredoxin family protein [Prevotella sp.]
MKKHLLSMLVLLSLVVAASAQLPQKKAAIQKKVQFRSSKVLSKVRRTPSITPSDNQLWWNNHDVEASWYLDGYGSAAHYDLAIYLPGDYFAGSDIAVDAISIFPIVKDMSNVKVWISKELPADGSSADLEVVTVSSSQLEVESFNDVAFKKSHKIPADGLFVGISFDEKDLKNGGDYAGSPILYTYSEKNRMGGYLFFDSSEKEWVQYDGNLVWSVLVSGKLADNGVSIADFGIAYSLNGAKTNSFSIPIVNEGQNPVTSVAYTVKGDGVTQGEKTVNVSIDDFKGTGVLEVSMNGEGSVGAFRKTITITKVNGKANDLNSGNESEGKVVSVSKSASPMPVAEEFTGTWCQYCPVGITYMELMEKKYGDKVIPIAVHAGDEMEVEDFYDVIDSYASSYPTVLVNRELDIYPTELNSGVDLVSKGLSPGTVALNATWADNSKKEVSFKTKTVFNFSDTGANYSLAYLLTEDGMKDDSWKQRNYFSGQSGDKNMAFWYSAPDEVSGLEFNHVAVAGWSVLDGVDGSLPATVSDGKAIDGVFNGDISGNTLIQDKSRLTAIVLLLDGVSGKILSAAKSAIGEPTGISLTEVSADKQSARYNLSGQRVGSNYRGIVVENGRKRLMK